MTGLQTVQLHSLYCVPACGTTEHWSGFGLAIKVEPERHRARLWQPDGITQVVDWLGRDIQLMSASAAMFKRYLAAYAWHGWYVEVIYWLPKSLRQYPQGRLRLRVPYSLVVYLGDVDAAAKHYKRLAELPSRTTVAGWSISRLYNANGEVQTVTTAQQRLPIALNIRRRRYYNGAISH